MLFKYNKKKTPKYVVIFIMIKIQKKKSKTIFFASEKEKIG
jgi:hypothetical protein